MEIRIPLFIYVLAIVLAVVAFIYVKRWKKRMQGDGPQLNLWQCWQVYMARRADDFVAESKVEHDFFLTRYADLRRKYWSFVDKGRQISDPLAESLRSLNDLIVDRIKTEDDKVVTYSQDVKDIIAARHRNWKEIQYDIQSMLSRTRS